jgi:hypothetical protein
MKLAQLSGVAAVALVAMTGAAFATSTGGTYTYNDYCGPGCDITVITSGLDYVLPALPYSALNLGSSATTGQVTLTPSGDITGSSAPVALPAGTDITSIQFAGGGPTSGLYAGSTVNSYLSPFGGSATTTTGGANYLVAGGGGGTVTIDYSTAQTSLTLLWGTVDTTPADYNLLSFLAGTQMITGADIAAVVSAEGGGTLAAGMEDVGVMITGLTSFTEVKATDNATPAFEFALSAVPAPVIGHGLLVALAIGGVLFGSKLLEERSKKRSSPGTATPHVA